MHEHVGKRANMQKNKESQTGAKKQARASIISHGTEKGMHQANQHHGDVFSQVVTPKQATRGMAATT